MRKHYWPWFLALVTLGSCPRLAWTEPRPDTAGLRTLMVMPERGEFLRYRVGWLRPRWREDRLFFTVVWRGDTLARKLEWAALFDTMTAHEVPDTAMLNLSLTLQRLERDEAGRVRRGPFWVRRFNPEQLLELDLRTRSTFVP